MNYLSNAFSLNMLTIDDLQFLRVRSITSDGVPQDVISTVGHRDIAAILTDMLGFEVAFNRTSLTLHEGDIVYVAQYVGPRLPEGTTTLPENSEIKFYEIRLPQDPCKKCHNRDCGLCRLKAAGFAGNNKSLWF